MKKAKPQWLGSQAGYTEKLLTPWEPMEVTNRIVKCWGREYEFNDMPFPTRITSAGESLLSRETSLDASVGGKEVSWRAKPLQIIHQSESMVILEANAESDELQIKGKIEIEFDGMMRINLTVIPKQKLNVILGFEVPLNPKHAKLLHYWPGKWGESRNSGALSREGWSSPFKPVVWVGDEDVGLAWFAESNEGWRPADTNRAIVIEHHEEEVILSINLNDGKYPLDKPFVFDFGLQATPVKPIPSERWDRKICHFVDYSADTALLDKAKELGVKTLVFHEDWTDIQNYTQTSHGDELKRLVCECHKRGINILLYFGYLMSTIAPEYDEYSEKCLVAPLDGKYQREPEQTAYTVCNGSIWADFIADGIAEVMDKYDVDGVYLDGTIEPIGCANKLHNCGYLSPEGKREKTYPVFATRNLIKRIYTICKERKEYALVDCHQSTCMMIPSLAFTTGYWDGEQFEHLAQVNNPLKELSLDSFRTEFMGRQWGVPAEFLVYDKRPFTFEQALAFVMQHNVLVRPLLGDDSLEKISGIWKALDDFGIKEAQWFPYWKNENLIKIKPLGIMVSFYRNGGKWLFVISNLDSSIVSVEVDLSDLLVTHLPGTRAIDALSLKNLVLDKDKLKLKIEPQRMRLVRIDS